MCSRFIEWPKLNVKQWRNPTTLALLLKIACLWERTSVVVLLKPQKRWRFFLILCFLLFLLLPSRLFPSSPHVFLNVPVVSPLPLRLSHWRLCLFLFPCSVSKWQWWEATVACCCHANQIRCHNRKWVHMRGRSTVTHAHDLLPLQAKWRPSRHRYTDMNLLWVKGNGTLCQPASYSLQQIWHHPVCRAFSSVSRLHGGNHRLSVMILRKICTYCTF